MLALTPPAEYLLAAGAAVAGLFTFPEPAEARIVYTPARKNIVCHGTDGGCHGTINLNLNHGRGADFRLLCSSTPYARGLWVTLVNSKNRVWTTPGYQRGAAAALSSGALIQSGSKFRATQLNMIWSSTNSEGYHGPWVYVNNRYLGLKFLIKGKVHYGWARLNTPKQWNGNQPWATLTGYAYETIANKPIIAGKTKGPDVITLEPASLGHLAQGASAIQAWRSKEQ